jgi:carbonic anhydrase/acetyltransferase-like protein (isoleucine patch superfamily)
MSIRRFENHTPKVASSAYIDESAQISGDVTIGEHSSIWPTTVIRGDVHQIRIGKHSNIQDGSILHVTHAGNFQPEGAPLTIGNYVTVGHRVILHGCTVDDFSLIGMGSIVLDNAVIETNVILGAGSLVPAGKTLSAGHLWLGTPARKIRPLSEQEIEFFKYSAEHYQKLKERTIESLK